MNFIKIIITKIIFIKIKYLLQLFFFKIIHYWNDLY